MSYSREFPHLAAVTGDMNPVILAHVRQNIDTFSIEVRIDYERWIQYCTEYEDWIVSNNKFAISEIERDYRAA